MTNQPIIPIQDPTAQTAAVQPMLWTVDQALPCGLCSGELGEGATALEIWQQPPDGELRRCAVLHIECAGILMLALKSTMEALAAQARPDARVGRA